MEPRSGTCGVACSMTLAKRNTRTPRARIINIGGDDIKILHVGFEVAENNWKKMNEIMRGTYPETDKAKSRAMRILVNAAVLGIVDLKELEKEIEKKAEKTKDVIYI